MSLSPPMPGRGRARVVAWFEARRAIASPYGVLASVLIAISYGWMIQRIGEWARSMSLGESGLRESGSLALGWFTDLPGPEVAALFGDHPPFLVVFFFVSLWLTPLLALVATCDQASSDIASKHVRFLLVRVGRERLFLGKAAGAFLFFAAWQAVATATALTFALIQTPTLATVLYAGRIFGTLALFSLPFVALMSFANTFMPHPMLSLVVGYGFQFVVWVLSGLGGIAFEGLRYVRFAYPTALRYQLASDDVSQVLVAAGHQLGLTVLFLAAGLAIFRWRDL